jgi:hypothetical protein
MCGADKQARKRRWSAQLTLNTPSAAEPLRDN